MKRYFGALIVIVLVTFFSSCQKEIDWELNDKFMNDSTTLWKYIEIDTTLPAGLDTLSIITFDYDNTGRLVSEKKVEKDFTVPPSTGFPHFNNTIYYYNGNDKFPSKAISTRLDIFGTGDDTTYLEYSNGNVIKDSMRSTFADQSGIGEFLGVNHYAVNGNITVVTQFRDHTLNPPNWPPPCPITTTYQITILNGNINSQLGNSSSCSGTGVSASNISFDNKPNPFYRFRIPYPIMNGFLEHGNIPKNNILENWFFIPTDGYIYSYTYRADGYPIAYKAFEISNPTDAWKGIFIYK